MKRLSSARRIFRYLKRLVGVAGVVAVLALGLWVGATWRRAMLTSPPATLYLQDRNGQFLGETGAIKEDEYGYWPLIELPPRVVAATLAVEDRRFNKHPGVDPLAMGRAILQNARTGRRLSGASTLAMQVARMQNPGPRRYYRKATEALTALFLTRRYGREAVLRHYLQIVPYGNRIHGIAYAARRYFDKPVEDLSWAEIAFLAAIPQAPARMNPFYVLGHQAAVRRGTRILDLLLDTHQLSREEHDLACSQIGEIKIPDWGERPLEGLHAILRLGKMLNTPELRQRLEAKPVVRTTLDLELQQTVTWKTFRALETWRRAGAGNGAVIVLDRNTNEVLAWVGSGNYFDKQHAGAIDYASVPRSPGSALKPFIYALALDRGTITPATILDDLQRGAGGITNADDAFLGPMLPRMALANSRNVPAANLLSWIGVDQGYDFLRDLRLHDNAKSARQYGLGLAIGGMPVTLEQLVRAYTVFSREGLLGDLIWYEGQTRREPRRLMSEETARVIALYLSDPLARLPSFARMGAMEYPFPVAIKTGTSSRFRDAWTVAFTSRYVIGVWFGDPDFQPMNRLTGYRSAAELVQRVLMNLHKDQGQGFMDYGFPPPRGYQPVRICAMSGLLATKTCDRVVEEWFPAGGAPVEYCKAHVLMAVDRRDSLPATPLTPPEFVEVRPFVDLAPQYAEWAASAGLPRLPGPRTDLTLMGSPESVPKVQLRITAPENGLRLLRDPETPAQSSTLALKADVNPPVPQLVWYVDREPFQLVDYPYSARWPAMPGEHVIQVRVPNTTIVSAPIRVIVN
jgi:penicillin-binding protein 1C